MPLLPVQHAQPSRRNFRDTLPQPANARKPGSRSSHHPSPKAVLLTVSFTIALFTLLDLAGFPVVRVTLCHAFPIKTATASASASAAAAAAADPVVLDTSAQALADAAPTQWSALTSLVLVAGHAIFTGDGLDPAHFADERNWILEPYQRGQLRFFLQHIERGVHLAANDSSSLLLFSGGQTRHNAGPRSEGLSYWLAAAASNWYGRAAAPAATSVRNRSLAEEYARDSFENLMFSVCRFRQVVGRYPRAITVVGFEFKRARFVEMHRHALRFPRDRFHYVGIDPPPPESDRLLAAERANTQGPFSSDPYGCKSSVLSAKRRARNPYLRFHPYPQGCPEMAPLFRHCGSSIYGGPLPWTRSIPDKAEK